MFHFFYLSFVYHWVRRQSSPMYLLFFLRVSLFSPFLSASSSSSTYSFFTSFLFLIEMNGNLSSSSLPVCFSCFFFLFIFSHVWSIFGENCVMFRAINIYLLIIYVPIYFWDRPPLLDTIEILFLNVCLYWINWPSYNNVYRYTARIGLKSLFTPVVGHYYYCSQIIKQWLRIKFHTLAGIEPTTSWLPGLLRD